MCFTDYHKAFDCIKHGELWLNMLEIGSKPHLMQLLWNLYQEQKAAVRIADAISEWFRVYKGVRQGYVLSLYLFNIVAEILCHYVEKVQR